MQKDRWLLLFCTALIAAAPARAQSGDRETCEPGTASAELNIGNVRAGLFNNGNLFYDGPPNLYEVPKGSGKTSVFTATLWMGGYVGSELRMAASTYSSYEFRPGPLFEDGSAPSDCTLYDRFWKVRKADLQHYETTGEASPDLLAWPVHLGAPVIDGDGDPNNYNLACGDRPAMLGEESLWWVMNDVAAPHRMTETEPIGIEAKVMAFAFNQVGWLGTTTFYKYSLTYRGSQPLTEAYLGLWIDPDLGDASDDYIGSDSTLSLGFAYNGRDIDSDYGERPPALGVTVLQGPRADDGERLGMSHFVYYGSDNTPQGNPQRAQEYYNYLRSIWRDGVPITFGGTGRDYSNEPAPYMYPAHPPAFWSQENLYNNGGTNPNDQRFVMSTGPFTMQPGETQEVVFAIVWTQAEEGAEHPRLASLAKLKSNVAHLLRNREAFLQTPRPGQECPIEVPEVFRVHGTYPNPLNQTTRLRFDLPEAAQVQVEVFDVLGRRVLRVPEQAMEAGRAREVQLEASGLAAGVYVYHLRVRTSSQHIQRAGRMVVVNPR